MFMLSFIKLLSRIEDILNSMNSRKNVELHYHNNPYFYIFSREMLNDYHLDKTYKINVSY